MSDSPSVRIQGCLDRLSAGDPAARDELLASAAARLERLTRKMLRDRPGVRRWEETADVYQNAMIRLCRALAGISPPNARAFFRLAALQVRRELIDLARHYYGPEGGGAHHTTHTPAQLSGSIHPAHDAADRTHDPARLALWTEFHGRVEELPDDDREVFDLLWYQGLKQEEAADLLGVSVRTVKSRWRNARLRLHEAVGELPED